MKTIPSPFAFRWLAATALVTLALHTTGNARADASGMAAFAGGAMVGAIASPYLQSYFPYGSSVAYGPSYNTMPAQTNVFYTPSPYMVVNHQPAVVYTSTYPTPPATMVYSGPSVMPYILLR